MESTIYIGGTTSSSLSVIEFCPPGTCGACGAHIGQIREPCVQTRAAQTTCSRTQTYTTTTHTWIFFHKTVTRSAINFFISTHSMNIVVVVLSSFCDLCLSLYQLKTHVKYPVPAFCFLIYKYISIILQRLQIPYTFHIV